jgi:hypothetical protein
MVLVFQYRAAIIHCIASPNAYFYRSHSLLSIEQRSARGAGKGKAALACSFEQAAQPTGALSGSRFHARFRVFTALARAATAARGMWFGPAGSQITRRSRARVIMT